MTKAASRRGLPRSREASTADSEYLVASRARTLTDRIARDLEAAGLEVPRYEPAPGAAYLPVLTDTADSLLTRLEVSQ